MKRFKDFKINENINLDDWDNQEISEKTKLIRDIIELQKSDPLFDKLIKTDDEKHIFKSLIDKIKNEFEHTSIEELKLFKEILIIDLKKNKLISDNYDTVIKLSNMINNLIKEMIYEL